MKATTFLTRLLAASGLVLLLIASPPESVGQQENAVGARAVVAIEIDVKKLFDAEAMKSQWVNDLLELWQENTPLAARIRNIERIRGVFCLPDSVSDVMEPPVGQPLPMDVLVRIEFDNGEAADDMYAAISASPLAEEIEVDGHTYIRPLDEMTNLRVHQFDLSTIEIATETFLMTEPFDLLSPGLESAWSQMPEQTVRIAIDLDGRRDFVDELVELARSNSPPALGGVFDLVNMAKDVRLGADLEAENLLTVTATAQDEDQAKQLRSGLDGLLGIAKFTGQQHLSALESESPEDAKIARELFDSLKATRDGVQVHVRIPRPDLFDVFTSRLLGGAPAEPRRSADLDRFRRIAIAAHSYYDDNSAFPITDDDEISWRVRILPYLGEDELYEQMDANKAWDHEANRPFEDQMPAILGDKESTTDVCWIKCADLPTRFTDITDGTVLTIMLLQVPEPVPWTQVNDLTIEQVLEIFDSLEPGQCLVGAFYDGSVRRLSSDIDRTILRNLLDPRDGNIVRDR